MKSTNQFIYLFRSFVLLKIFYVVVGKHGSSFENQKKNLRKDNDLTE